MKILLLSIFLSLGTCSPPQKTIQKQSAIKEFVLSDGFSIVVIDQCQYIMYSSGAGIQKEFAFEHKGNCTNHRYSNKRGYRYE